MGNGSPVVSSRVALAIIGAIVVGGISAAVAARPAVHSDAALADTGRSQTSRSSLTLATPRATASHKQSAAPHARPTATPRPGPPAPTATPLPSLQGTVTSTSPFTSSFVLGLDGAPPMTVDVNSNTVFRGAASSLSTLASGMQADVRGVHQSDGTFLASWVDVCSGVSCDT
jgi:Domain of unknown function (DUF5666)